MPLFDFKCIKCANEFTKLLNKRKEMVNCPKCNSKAFILISKIAKPKHSSDSWRNN